MPPLMTSEEYSRTIRAILSNSKKYHVQTLCAMKPERLREVYKIIT